MNGRRLPTRATILPGNRRATSQLLNGNDGADHQALFPQPVNEMTIDHEDQSGERNSALARRIARESYPYKCCVVCGLTQDGALQVAHLNQNSADNTPENLTFLCWTHHRMYDMGLYPQEAIEISRAHWQKRKGVPDHGIYMKNAGVRAAKARRLSAIARKAWATRRSKTSQVD